MDLLAENRSLIHTGKLLRQPDTGFEWSGWSELFVLLFDNYRKSKGREGAQAACLLRSHISGDDETKREGWHHEIPCQPAGMCFLPTSSLSVKSDFRC
jgi:hypothetical protein